jgi:hypothetical protein
MLAREVNAQLGDRRPFLMGHILHEVYKALNWPKIMAYHICFNLIIAVFDSKSSSIAALIYIFSQVFYSPNGGTNFNIDMAMEYIEEI